MNELHRCIICGYLYSQEEGDPLHDVDPNTLFDEIPESWVCPICGASKEHFEKI